MRDQAQAGAIELVYFDESGFAQVHPNRSAWTPCGEQHCIEAPRGQRLNVMAALFSSGKAVHTRCWSSSTAELFLGFVAEVAKHATKPVVIVLDNASIHRAAAIQ
ncbi:MAG: transposase, partial [Hydrogenophaga sp.]|nr:transposase [Hydrogenophaga sp.]